MLFGLRVPLLPMRLLDGIRDGISTTVTYMYIVSSLIKSNFLILFSKVGNDNIQGKS